MLRRGKKALEPESQSVAVGRVLQPARQMELSAGEALQGIEHGSIMLDQKFLGHVDPVVWVNSN